jgi:hypothetical protein
VSLIAQVSWSKAPRRPSNDSRRSICIGARRRTPFRLDSDPASRRTDSECTAAYCGRITRKLQAFAPGSFPGGSFYRLPLGGRILVLSRTAGLVKESVCRTNGIWTNRVLTLIQHHLGATILLAQSVVSSNVVSLRAGQAGLSAAQFLIYDCIGSLTWSGSCIAFGYVLHGQLHWTLAQTLRSCLVVRAAVSLGRL